MGKEERSHMARWFMFNPELQKMTDTCRLISSGKRMTFAQAINWASSPLSASSCTISNPPTSSPFTINWGNVGHSFRTFSPKNNITQDQEQQNLGNENRNYTPCLTLSSVKISKWLNSIFFPWSNAQIFRENPQRGTSGLPFMNKTTLDWFIKPRSLAFSSSSVSFFSLPWSTGGSTLGAFAGDCSVRESGVSAEGVACLATAWVSAVASAPDMRSKRIWPYVSPGKFKTAWF